jgi:6-phosphogluconolactonase
MSKQPSLYSFPSTDAIAPQLRTYILNAQKAALSKHSLFRIAVSGGSLPAVLSKALLTSPTSSDDTPKFSQWEIFFADERAVPLDHADSNYALLKSDLLDKIPSGDAQPKVHSIDASLLSDTQSLADAYSQLLTASFASKDSVRLPQFDLILLGCGPDGHTCSLFPSHPLLRETDAWVAAIEDSPKPPARRITLTLPVVTHAHRVGFVATGAGKKEVLKKIFETEEGRSLPCGLVNEGAGERVSWFVDEAAVQGVTVPRRGSL